MIGKGPEILVAEIDVITTAVRDMEDFMGMITAGIIDIGHMAHYLVAIAIGTVITEVTGIMADGDITIGSAMTVSGMPLLGL